MSEETPQVEMKWEMWCDRHLRALKPQWPKGAAFAQLALFQAAMSNPGIQLAVEARGSVQAALDAHSPLCCFLGDKTAIAITSKALRHIVHCVECDNKYPKVPCKLCQAMEERRKNANP